MTTTLRFQFNLPHDVKATVIQDTHDAGSVVNYEHKYTMFDYQTKALLPDVVSVFNQRIHVNYEQGEMTNELTITYEVVNARPSRPLLVLDRQEVPAQSKALFEFKYVKEDGDASFKLLSIHRGINEIFMAGDGSGKWPRFEGTPLDFRHALEITFGRVCIPLVSAKFEQSPDLQIPLEAL